MSALHLFLSFGHHFFHCGRDGVSGGIEIPAEEEIEKNRNQ